MDTGISGRSHGLLLLLLIGFAAQAQTNCPRGGRLEGDVVDPTGAVIPGAHVSWSGGGSATSDPAGHYILGCVAEGTGQLTAEAPNFATLTKQLRIKAGSAQRQTLTLALASVQAEVSVSADSSPESSATDSVTLNAEQVKELPDDPDDLLARLQILAAEYGGDPTTARVMVDGFLNSSALPPKSSIASIRINPDFFSSEYQWPPYSGGTIEITTKPGTSSMHGAVFFTGGPGAINATDPFSLTPTPASRNRYGFEFSERLIPQRADISLALEKRDIDEFNIVNAQTLGSDGNAVPFQQSVSAPQRLWIASARSGWQFGPKDSGFVSFSANVNDTQNQGVGGLVLPEAGYTSMVGEYDLRLANTLIATPNLLNETRIGYTWKRNKTTPNSAATSLQVAGFFTGGGALTQNRNDRERDLEVDDDAVWTRGRHTLKFGAQTLSNFVHDFNPNSFNGTFIFGGATAPVLDANGEPTGETTTITGLEQYRRALAGLPGGTPTTYEVVAGEPLVTFLQWNAGLFVEETFKLSQRFTVAGGLRYQMQTSPNAFANFDPRFGFDWAMNRKSTWLLHAHAGLFNDTNSINEIGDGFRLNGVRQTQHNVYSPSFSNPLVPVTGSIATTTIQQFAPQMTQKSTFNLYLNVEHIFAHQWAARVNYYLGEDWNRPVLININAPLVASSNNTVVDPTAALLAPRPGPPNENVMQYQNSGHLDGNLVSVTLNQHSYKWFGLSTYYRHANFKSDGGDGVSTPQSSYSTLGESGRADWLRSDAGTVTGNVIFPRKIDADVEFYSATGAAFNILTGTDNNGDGVFNDRPAYATAPGAGVYSTRYGLLTSNAVNGDVPRNTGTMPPLFELSLNLNRSFTLNKGDKDHPRTLSLNARAANLLNHTNVTSVNQVLSTTLGQAAVAQPARRIEFGARFAF